MIEKALIEITVNTDEDSVNMEVINGPKFTEQTLREFTENHPAAALAHGIVLKINQELNITAKDMEQEYDA